jgi:hypothetical protein
MRAGGRGDCVEVFTDRDVVSIGDEVGYSCDVEVEVASVRRLVSLQALGFSRPSVGPHEKVPRLETVVVAIMCAQCLEDIANLFLQTRRFPMWT